MPPLLNGNGVGCPLATVELNEECDAISCVREPMVRRTGGDARVALLRRKPADGPESDAVTPQAHATVRLERKDEDQKTL